MIAVCQTFITYLDYYLYITGQGNQQRMHQLRRCIHYLCYVTSSVLLKENFTNYFHFSSYRPCKVECLMTTAQFHAKWLILIRLLCQCGCLIIIINYNCDKLNCMGFAAMETILCNGCLALSEFLFKKMEVRYITFINCVLPACCISSTCGLCQVIINLIGMLMQFLLNFNNCYFHRCGLILLKTNITYWLVHLRHHMKAQGLLK